MTSDPTSLSDHVKVFAKEAQRRLLTLTALFAVVAVVALGVGLMLPKRYDASTLILVEANNIIKPLMEGRAVPTSVADQTAVVTSSSSVARGCAKFSSSAGGSSRRRRISPIRAKRSVCSSSCARTSDREHARRDGAHLVLRQRSQAHLPGGQQARRDVRAREPGRQGAREPRGVRVHRQAGQGVRRQARRHPREGAGAISQAVAASRRWRGERRPRRRARRRWPRTRRSPPRSWPICAPKRRCSRRRFRARPAAARRRASTPAPRTRRATASSLQENLDRLLGTFTDEHPDVKKAKRELAVAKEESVARREGHGRSRSRRAAGLAARR